MEALLLDPALLDNPNGVVFFLVYLPQPPPDPSTPLPDPDAWEEGDLSEWAEELGETSQEEDDETEEEGEQEYLCVYRTYELDRLYDVNPPYALMREGHQTYVRADLLHLLDEGVHLPEVECWFLCPHCGCWVDWQCGAADSNPEACDVCWLRLNPSEQEEGEHGRHDQAQ